MFTLRITVESPERLDKLLLREMETQGIALSRAALKELFKSGKVLLQGRAVSASLELRPGEHEAAIRDWNPEATAGARAAISSLGSFLPIVYEDSDLLVLNKATGVPSVPHSEEETETAVGSALAHFPGLQGIGKNEMEAGLLHRLDTGTSGLLVFAKTALEYERLHRLWKERQVRKIYRALVAPSDGKRGDGERGRGIGPGGVSSNTGTVDTTPPPAIPSTLELILGHDAGSAKRMIAFNPETLTSRPDLLRRIRGKPLPTRSHLCSFLPIGTPSGESGTGPLAEVVIEIETGVMHQIRCSLAYLGWPVAGDPIYRGVPSSRLWLHAWRLEFPLSSGQILALEARLPEGWPAR